MSGKKIFKTDKAAVTGGPYSQAVIHNGLIYVSGQGAVDPATNEIRLGTIEEETALGMENLRIVIEEAGSGLENVLTMTVYLLDIDEYSRFNEVYKQYFEKDLPARTCIQAGNLPFGTRVEITATAYLQTEKV